MEEVRRNTQDKGESRCKGLEVEPEHGELE